MNPLMKWNAQIPGTTHDGGFRSGTVDVPGIVAFVTSTNSVCNDMMNERVRMRKLRATLLDQMENFEQPFEIEGSETHGIPDVLGLRITHMEGQRSEEHTSELQSRGHRVCRLLPEKKT